MQDSTLCPRQYLHAPLLCRGALCRIFHQPGKYGIKKRKRKRKKPPLMHKIQQAYARSSLCFFNAEKAYLRRSPCEHYGSRSNGEGPSTSRPQRQVLYSASKGVNSSVGLLCSPTKMRLISVGGHKKKTDLLKKLEHFSVFDPPNSVLPTKMTYGNLFIFVFFSPIAVRLNNIFTSKFSFRGKRCVGQKKTVELAFSSSTWFSRRLCSMQATVCGARTSEFEADVCYTVVN